MHTDVSAETDMDLVVTGRDDLAEGVVTLMLGRADGSELPAWQPGAHVDLCLTDSLIRQYSLCGEPADRSRYRVAVLREPAGRGGSAHVHDRLTVGTTVRVHGPRNHFPLVESPRYLFVGGGIGITPLVPMVAAAEAAGADWQLAYGGRTRASMAFAQELSDRYPGRVTLAPQDETGLLDLDRILAGAAGAAHVYCCGPEPLLAAVESRCRGLANRTLHVERFAPKAGDPSVLDGSFEVELALSEKVVIVPQDKSILEVLEDEGMPVASSCGEGTCGTCEVQVVAGLADHRDSLLSEEEQEAGETMFICVSRSRTPRLVLQL